MVVEAIRYSLTDGKYDSDIFTVRSREDFDRAYVAKKHIFFIAETKGSLSSMDLTRIGQTKIDCAKKLFNSLSTAKVRYHQVTAYQDLIDAMNGAALTP